MVLVAPSVLSADFANLAQNVARAAAGGADYLHFDVMDGRFVTNITVGAPVLGDLAASTDLKMDVHLMVHEPGRYTQGFKDAGAHIITIHAEACRHLHGDLQRIRGMGALAGVSVNPATPLSAIEEVLLITDLVLIMTVNPGFGGQKFIAGMLPKIRRAREMCDAQDHSIILEVDGGVTSDNVAEVVAAGADMVVAGSAVFGRSGDGDIEGNIKLLKEAGK